MSKYEYMTQEGYDQLVAELDDLKSRGRREAADAIAEARDKGDLSENAEYDAAKDAQGMLEFK
ncbi:MAG: transcription elongation factor GreA, partial [Saprospiraceae bacterium]|nr:transcription elongation factor GreA [Saprospiraceae bacterium]